MKGKTIVVISDIHIGAGELDDFDTELEGHFCDFLEMLVKKDFPVELIVNGDFLEFIQAPPWEESDLESESSEGFPLCFTEEQSMAKLEAIYKAHKDTFLLLKDFLKSDPEKKLTIIPGNHDVDFFWENIRKKFLSLICGEDTALKNRIYFHLDQVYRPIDFPYIWIEHGHQYDPVNSFHLNGNPCWSYNSPPIFKDKDDKKRLLECAGTRFLVKYVNKLNDDFPLLKSIKPIERLLYLGLSIFNKNYGPIKLATAFWNFFSYLAEILTDQPSDILSMPKLIDPRPVLRKMAKSMTRNEKMDLLRSLKGYGLHITQPFEMYIDNIENANKLLNLFFIHTDLLDGVSIIETDTLSYDNLNMIETLSFGKYFIKSQNRVLLEKAISILDNNNAYIVIMGHTHQRTTDLEQKYINTGTWNKNHCRRKKFDFKNQKGDETRASFSYGYAKISTDISIEDFLE